MKTSKPIMLFTAMLFSAAMCMGQKIMTYQVPEEVLSSFRDKFPDASAVNWSKNENMNYEAQFMITTNTTNAEFDKNGRWVETENSIQTSQLPDQVKSAVMKKSPSCKIADAEEVQSADLGKMYEVGCSTKSGKSDYRVSPEGKLKETPLKKF